MDDWDWTPNDPASLEARLRETPDESLSATLRRVAVDLAPTNRSTLVGDLQKRRLTSQFVEHAMQSDCPRLKAFACELLRTPLVAYLFERDEAWIRRAAIYCKASLSIPKSGSATEQAAAFIEWAEGSEISFGLGQIFRAALRILGETSDPEASEVSNPVVRNEMLLSLLDRRQEVENARTSLGSDVKIRILLVRGSSDAGHYYFGIRLEKELFGRVEEVHWKVGTRPSDVDSLFVAIHRDGVKERTTAVRNANWLFQVMPSDLQKLRWSLAEFLDALERGCAKVRESTPNLESVTAVVLYTDSSSVFASAWNACASLIFRRQPETQTRLGTALQADRRRAVIDLGLVERPTDFVSWFAAPEVQRHRRHEFSLGWMTRHLPDERLVPYDVAAEACRRALRESED